MQYGTMFGHGAYLGPDFTAQYLHLAAVEMLAFHAERGFSPDEAQAQVRRELKQNAYDPATGVLVFTAAQARAFARLVEFYRIRFGPTAEQNGLQRPHIADPQATSPADRLLRLGGLGQRRHPARSELLLHQQLAARTAGGQRADRRGPPLERAEPDRAAGRHRASSSSSSVATTGSAGTATRTQDARKTCSSARRTRCGSRPSQRATAWYFLVVAGLFLLQGLLGGANAHYHVEPAGFYGLEPRRAGCPTT